MERFNDVITHAHQYINGGGELMRVAPSALGPTAVCHFCFLLLLLFYFIFICWLIYYSRLAARVNQPVEKQRTQASSQN